MYILFLVTLVIHTTVLVAAQQTTGDIPTADDPHQHQQHHEHQQSLFNNQSQQFGAQTKDDETLRGNFQQIAKSLPVNDSNTNRQDQKSATKEETDLQQHSTGKLSVTENFRLEFNKYKILSHLGITANPDELTPQLDEDLRSKLTATTAFTSSSDQSKAVRHKRSLSCNQVNGNKNTCCLENFYVNFTHIGWDKWILYPAGYNANYCRGHCDLSHARYYHSTLLSKYSNIVSLCCSPKQMGSLRLLYIDENNKVHQKTIPDMVVESCDCA